MGNELIKRGTRSARETVRLNPSKSISGPVQENHPALARARAEQGQHPYYEHLRQVYGEQHDETRSGAHRPRNRSDSGPEGIGRSSAHGRVFNESDEGRSEGDHITPEGEKELQDELDKYEGPDGVLAKKRKAYNRSPRLQREYSAAIERASRKPAFMAKRYGGER